MRLMKKLTAFMTAAVLCLGSVMPAYADFYRQPSNIKGVLINSESEVTDVVEVGASQVVCNFPMSWAFQPNMMNAYGSFLRAMDNAGITVTMIVLNDWNAAAYKPELLPVSAPVAGVSYYGFNTLNEQGVQAIHGPALHGDTDHRQRSVGGKCTGQMGCHAGRAQDDAKAVGLCALGKRSRLGGRAVCRQDVCFKGDIQRFELGTGPLDHRPIAVGTHDHSNFTNHNPNPLFPLLTNKKGSGTPAPQPLFLRILFPCLARSCTMPLTCTNIVSFHATRQRLFHGSLPPQFLC